jgi:hypothetical protein
MDEFQTQLLGKLDAIIEMLKHQPSVSPGASTTQTAVGLNESEKTLKVRACDGEEDIPGFSRFRAAYPSGFKTRLTDARRYWRAQRLEPRTDEMLCALSLYKRYYKKWKENYICDIAVWIHQCMYQALDFVPRIAAADQGSNPDWWKPMLPKVISDQSSINKYSPMTFGELPPWLSSELLCRRYSPVNR